MSLQSRMLAIVAVMAITLMGTTSALAQGATPATAESPFASLGLPELTVTITDTGFELSESEVSAGRYLVNVINQSSNPEASAGFVRLSEGKTLNDLTAADEMASGTPLPGEGPAPESYAWLYDTYIAGGTSALANGPGQVVLDLRGGDYGVWADDPAAPLPAAGLTVSGDPDARVEGPEPEAALTVVEEGEGGVGFKFTATGEAKAGPQIVKVLNASDQPHLVVGFQYPEELTTDQILTTFMYDPSMGTPPPNLLDDSKLSFPGYAGVQSIGTTQWVLMDFAPESLALVCFIPDPAANQAPHFMEGMITVLPVAGS